MSDRYDHIRVAVDDDGIATLTFDRPEVRNALDLAMNREVRDALDELGAREDLRALVLTGAGDRAFVSGADIAELRDRRGPEALAQHNARLCDAIEAFPRPTIAAIRGAALGGGCEVALACDLRVAGRSAKLGQPEVGLGILPAAGGTWRLPRLVGLARAKELIFTGEVLDGERAHELGLVNRVVDDAEVSGEAGRLAASIARQSPMAVRLAKLALDGGRESPQATGRRLEALAQTVLYDDPETHRRMTDFLERRERKRAARREAEAGGGSSGRDDDE